MHMADGFISPAVGCTMWAASAAITTLCARKVRQEKEMRLVPLMGVLGAFIFACQMLNFTIPGTGSSGHLGGTSLRTRELILLCEAAGYDVVIVETVGVGQSETEVSRLVDCFISLQIAGGGDDLQGIKKGSMEMADIVVINKDDGENRASVAITRHMYESALHILRRKHAAWQPRVLSCSALERRGIENGNRAGLRQLLRIFRALVNYAKDELHMYGANPAIFEAATEKMAWGQFESKAVNPNIIRRMEFMDRSLFSEQE